MGDYNEAAAPVRRPTGVLFICMGNICRSPTAEGVFRHKVQAAGLQSRFAIDSAGTHNYHPGEPPDARSQHHARLRGYELGELRARTLHPADSDRFDWLVVMDERNYSTVLARMGAAHEHKLHRLASFCRQPAHRGLTEVPDPYYGERADFERVLDLIEDGCDGLLAHLRAQAGGR